ncbi:MAG: hypothetical protein U0325_33135 [Polyangiales bacterium]
MPLRGDRRGWQTCGADRRLGACVCGDGGASATPLPMCVDPFARCNGRCANLLVDQENCGRCGTVCPAGRDLFQRVVRAAGRRRGGALDVPVDAPAADVIADDAPTVPDAPSADGAEGDAAVDLGRARGRADQGPAR